SPPAVGTAAVRFRVAFTLSGVYDGWVSSSRAAAPATWAEAAESPIASDHPEPVPAAAPADGPSPTARSSSVADRSGRGDAVHSGVRPGDRVTVAVSASAKRWPES